MQLLIINRCNDTHTQTHTTLKNKPPKFEIKSLKYVILAESESSFRLVKSFTFLHFGFFEEGPFFWGISGEKKPILTTP
jgi:hypothetical protein